MWGTDATRFYTEADGWCWFFGAIDHGVDEARPGTQRRLAIAGPSYVGEPECNGVIERFMRTLKEQCLYVHRFQSLAEAPRTIGEFIARYNTAWLIERLGHQTPVGARMAMAAA